MSMSNRMTAYVSATGSKVIDFRTRLHAAIIILVIAGNQRYWKHLLYGLRMRPVHKEDPWCSYVEVSRTSRTRESRLFLLGAALSTFKKKPYREISVMRNTHNWK